MDEACVTLDGDSETPVQDTPDETAAAAFPRSTGAVAQATEVFGLLNDPRWALYIESLATEYARRFRQRAEHSPASLDGAFERQRLLGAAEGVDRLMSLFTALRSRCERIVIEAVSGPGEALDTRGENIRWWNPMRGRRGKVGGLKAKSKWGGTRV